jgi:hypothetical protein
VLRFNGVSAAAEAGEAKALHEFAGALLADVCAEG